MLFNPMVDSVKTQTTVTVIEDCLGILWVIFLDLFISFKNPAKFEDEPLFFYNKYSALPHS